MAMATVQVATAKPTANHRDNRQGKRNGNRGLSHYLRISLSDRGFARHAREPTSETLHAVGRKPALAPNLPKTLNVGDA
jgi:hypothetical protein